MYAKPYRAAKLAAALTLNQKVRRILTMSRFAPTQEELEREHSESLAEATEKDMDETKYQKTKCYKYKELKDGTPIVTPEGYASTKKTESSKSNEPIAKKWKAAQMSLDSTFTFGKHKGSELQEVIENHKSYIDWAVDKEVIELDEEAFEYYSTGVKTLG